MNSRNTPLRPAVWLLAFALLPALSLLAAAGEKPGADSDPLEAWWKETRTRIEKALAAQGRTTEALESPKWFEQPYNTVGRMPLIDKCLAEPLVMPEVAGYTERRAREAKGSMKALFLLADDLCNRVVNASRAKIQWAVSDEVTEKVRPALEGCELFEKLPESVKSSLLDLISCAAFVHTLRERAFSGLSAKERRRAGELFPGYFVKPTPGGGEAVRGYTTNTDDNVELVVLLRKVDFEPLLDGAALLAGEIDAFIEAVRKNPPAEAGGEAAPLRVETSFGGIELAGTGDDRHEKDCAVLIDLGGDDLYVNHASATSLEGPGASVLVDVSGNDRYVSGGFSQSCAVAGIAALVDMAGDDVYASGHYSQGAALGGVSFFCEEGGDDVYSGGLGVQCFSIFGYSLFMEGSGRDSYRCAAMGQGSASTLGVSILAEGGGDDSYRAGGKYGFYVGWDSSCAQGSASGMRPWPPSGKITVYGGIGFLGDAGGNDTYHCYNIGQGGSYIFSLGMLVDETGDDTYYGRNYTRGVGVHLSAGVCIDREGNDIHMGDYGQNGMSLDRSAGIFLDLAGDDLYRVKGGLAYATKPRGLAVFADVSGDDRYSGADKICGFCFFPYGDDAECTTFFFDYGGEDAYPDKKFSNRAAWTEREFGSGEDMELPEPRRGKAPWWAPAPARAPGNVDDEARALVSPRTLVRFPASVRLMEAADPEESAFPAWAAALKGGKEARMELIDVLRIWLLKKKLKPGGNGMGVLLRDLLRSDDRDLRLLGLHAVGELEETTPDLLNAAGAMAVSDPSLDVRGMACLALGRTKTPAVLPYLLKALKSPAWAVRRRAASGLKELGSKDAGADLLTAVLTDPAPAVRGRACEALGACGVRDGIKALEAALLDRSELVRFFAARALLKDFARAEAMEHFFPLLRWREGPLRDQLVGDFLRAYTGQTLPMKEEAWRSWWDSARPGFDGKKQAEIFALWEEARKIAREGEEDRALEMYRSIRTLQPGHAGACVELSTLLNSRAWAVAVGGGDLEAGLKMAEESVDAKEDGNNVDTLAVLQYLTGRRKEAMETVRKALEKYKGNAAELLRNRLAEFEKGSLNLH